MYALSTLEANPEDVQLYHGELEAMIAAYPINSILVTPFPLWAEPVS